MGWKPYGIIATGIMSFPIKSHKELLLANARKNIVITTASMGGGGGSTKYLDFSRSLKKTLNKRGRVKVVVLPGTQVSSKRSDVNEIPIPNPCQKIS